MPDQQTVVPIPAGERVQATQNALDTIENNKNGHQGEGGGQPTVITDIVVLDLITAFQNGLDVRSACTYAGIGKTAYYERCKADTKFADRMERAKNNLRELAGDRIAKIIKSGDERTAGPLAWKVFERTMPETYGAKAVQAGPNKTQNNNFFVMNHGQITDIAGQPDIIKTTPAKLFEALEEANDVVDSGEEGSAS